MNVQELQDLLADYPGDTVVMVEARDGYYDIPRPLRQNIRIENIINQKFPSNIKIVQTLVL